MPSTYTALGVQKMATGEKAGTWGTLTNTNWDIIEQISGGYTTQAVTDGADTDLSVSDGATGATLAHRCIQLTGSLTAGRNVTIPLDVQQIYIIKNATSGSQVVTFKYVSGSGSSVAIANGDTVLVYATANDGTNPDIVDSGFGASTSPGGSTTQIQYNNSGAFGGDADLIWTAGTGMTINSQKELRLADTDDSAYIGFKAAGTTTSYTLTMPAAVATANAEKINGSAADLTVSVERAAFTLVYTDSTQGWLLKDK